MNWVGKHSTPIIASIHGRMDLLGHRSEVVDSFAGFICSKCAKIYKTKNSLNRHVSFECGIEPSFICPFCNHKTKYMTSLNRHILKMHPGEPLINTKLQKTPTF